ncbi:hypothetical protein CALVIDRAFT_524206 [Calocera viscosa TUFC12733]|uniref:AA1-like domain-containing protein n=1 Tax=Calocera viscosa (strain TUFC12733) TaxID=1330018 RepID=A0A167RM10_CALVF|nr:hypothetical protein CALVIDRAFT_524206 [Calocera viscosa TUFC12733]
MQFLTSLVALLAAVPFMVQAAAVEKRSILGIDTFGETSCNGFQEFIHITQQGANSATFPGPRESFLVTESDGDCEAILWTGDFTGDKLVFSKESLTVGTCFGASNGEAFNSFDFRECIVSYVLRSD